MHCVRHSDGHSDPAAVSAANAHPPQQCNSTWWDLPGFSFVQRLQAVMLAQTCLFLDALHAFMFVDKVYAGCMQATMQGGGLSWGLELSR